MLEKQNEVLQDFEGLLRQANINIIYEIHMWILSPEYQTQSRIKEDCIR